jgi:hypothetical protein
MSVGLLLLWLHTLRILFRFDSLGPLVYILFEMFKDVAQWALLQMLFTLAFGVAMYSTYHAAQSTAPHPPPQSHDAQSTAPRPHHRAHRPCPLAHVRLLTRGAPTWQACTSTLARGSGRHTARWR